MSTSTIKTRSHRKVSKMQQCLCRNTCAAFAIPTPLTLLSPLSYGSSKHSSTIVCATAFPSLQTRRIAISAASAIVLAFSSLSPSHAVISAEQCIGGEGPGCEAAASESPIVRELLEKSRANRARHDKETLEEYWARGYGDYFSFGYNKELVKGEDGKWSLETPNDLRTQMENRLIDMIRKRKVASTGGSADQG